MDLLEQVAEVGCVSSPSDTALRQDPHRDLPLLDGAALQLTPRRVMHGLMEATPGVLREPVASAWHRQEACLLAIGAVSVCAGRQTPRVGEEEEQAFGELVREAISFACASGQPLLQARGLWLATRYQSRLAAEHVALLRGEAWQLWLLNHPLALSSLN